MLHHLCALLFWNCVALFPFVWSCFFSFSFFFNVINVTFSILLWVTVYFCSTDDRATLTLDLHCSQRFHVEKRTPMRCQTPRLFFHDGAAESRSQSMHEEVQSASPDDSAIFLQDGYNLSTRRWHCPGSAAKTVSCAVRLPSAAAQSHRSYSRSHYKVQAHSIPHWFSSVWLPFFFFFFLALAKHIGCISSATVCVPTINETLPLWMSSPLSPPPPTVSSGGQPHQAGDGHHGSAGVMRERRAAGDPYWSYSGEPPFMLGNGLRSLSRRGNIVWNTDLVKNKIEKMQPRPH